MSNEHPAILDTFLSEKQKQLGLLNTRLGEPGSGYIRYGAAMWLFQNGLMSNADLESYRICCKLDSEDPLKLSR